MWEIVSIVLKACKTRLILKEKCIRVFDLYTKNLQGSEIKSGAKPSSSLANSAKPVPLILAWLLGRLRQQESR